MRECRKVQYRPEGMLIGTPENREILSSESNLERAATTGKIIEGMAVMCDRSMTLQVDLGCMRGIIPREEAALTPDGAPPKDIAVITRVGKPVCFKVIGTGEDRYGRYYRLSRREAQIECMRNYLDDLIPGDVISAKVTHLEPFGAFVDIGCGISSLLSVDCISVSRIALRKYPFATVGQLLVCPPSTAPFAARTAFGVCPFPRPCPARHLVPVTLGETRLYLWLLLIVWHFSWFVKDFFSSFSTNPVILLGLFAQNTLQIPKKGQTNAPGYATLRQTT